MAATHWSDQLILYCRRLFLHNFEIPINIGIHDFEKQSPQRVRLNVDMYVLLRDSSPKHDNINEVVDYDFIRSTIIERAAVGHIQLQETLCDDIAATLLKHPKVCAVRVCTEKPDAYVDCEAVGIEIFRIKQDTLSQLAESMQH